jgi:hypothetical protein
MAIRSLSLLIAVTLLSPSVQAQTLQSSVGTLELQDGSLPQGSAQSQLCVDDPTYCSTMGSTTSASSSSSGAISSSSGTASGGSATPAPVPHSICGDGFPMGPAGCYGSSTAARPSLTDFSRPRPRLRVSVFASSLPRPLVDDRIGNTDTSIICIDEPNLDPRQTMHAVDSVGGRKRWLAPSNYDWRLMHTLGPIKLLRGSRAAPFELNKQQHC